MSNTDSAGGEFLLAGLLASLPEQIYFKDTQSRYLAVSHSKALWHGLTPEQMRGKGDRELFPAEFAQATVDDDQLILSSGQPRLDHEEKVNRPDGSVAWLSTSKLPLRNPAGEVIGLIGVSRNITAAKQAEVQMREQAEIIDHSPLAIFISDLDNRITYCNRGAARLYGMDPESFLGLHLEKIFTTDTIMKLADSQSALGGTGHWTGIIPVQTRHGRQFQAEFHLSPIHDDTGRTRARLHIAIDITEKLKLEGQFLRAQRLESLGMLAAGIAHDLNNVLAPLLMGAPLLRTRLTQPSDHRILQTMETSAGRGAALVKQILSFAHGAGGEKSLLQAKHILRDITGLMEQTFPKNIRVEEHLPRDLWPILGNPTQLHQVVLNLCVNARDAMPTGGSLRIVAENQTIDGVTAKKYSGAVPGPYIRIEVTDSGTGIPDEILERIWDPFFTTKGEGRGTGLGLGTARGIVANHGGFVSVDTQPGRGTTFRVYLPAAAQSSPPLETIEEPAAAEDKAGHGQLILVVDDQSGIREFLKDILERAGYRVILAANGAEAMDLFLSRAKEIPLVVSDLDMPEMGGSELADALSRLNQGVRILFMSGADSGKLAEAIPASAVILRKPFTRDRLLVAVKQLLATSPGGKK